MISPAIHLTNITNYYSDTSMRVGYILLLNCVNCVIRNVIVSPQFRLTTSPNHQGIHLINCTNCVIQDCSVYSTLNTVGWTRSQFDNQRNLKIKLVGGSNNTIRRCSMTNTGGIDIQSRLTNILECNITNFVNDAIQIKSSLNIIEGNRIIGSIKSNTVNHNDIIQIFSSSHNRIKNNTLIAYNDATRYASTDTQGIGCFDGIQTNHEISNNIIKVAHPIGIWIHGGINCLIENNTIEALLPLYNQNRKPSIAILDSKTGQPSKHNIVKSNKAPNFELQFRENCFNQESGNILT